MVRGLDFLYNLLLLCGFKPHCTTCEDNKFCLSQAEDIGSFLWRFYPPPSLSPPPPFMRLIDNNKKKKLLTAREVLG